MNLICGINPVLEALSAGTRHFDRVLVVKGLRNRRISDAIGKASRLGIPLRFEARETLDRMAGGVPHQGLIAVVSAKPLAKLLDRADGHAVGLGRRDTVARQHILTDALAPPALQPGQRLRHPPGRDGHRSAFSSSSSSSNARFIPSMAPVSSAASRASFEA